MSFAYMPFYTGDYLRDTRHLSMSEHGAYLLMLSYCWDAKGPLPLDERKLLGICNARSGDEIEAVRRVVIEFFVRMDDGWYNHRMQKEVERSEALSKARSEAGRSGYEAKAKQLPNKRQSSAKHKPLSSSSSSSLSLSSTLNQGETKSSCAERDALDPVFIEIDTVNPVGKTAVKESLVKELEDAFPNVDVRDQLRRVAYWANKNPEKRKTAKGLPKFLGGWMGRAVSSGDVRQMSNRASPPSIYEQSMANARIAKEKIFGAESRSVEKDITPEVTS